MIHSISVRVRTDVTIEQPDFSIFDQSVTVLQIYFTFTDRFDFRTLKNHSGLEGFENLVIVIGLSVQSGSTFFHEVDYSWCKSLIKRSDWTDSGPVPRTVSAYHLDCSDCWCFQALAGALEVESKTGQV